MRTQELSEWMIVGPVDWTKPGKYTLTVAKVYVREFKDPRYGTRLVVCLKAKPRTRRRARKA